jgi:hypothetical protein
MNSSFINSIEYDKLMYDYSILHPNQDWFAINLTVSASINHMTVYLSSLLFINGVFNVANDI